MTVRNLGTLAIDQDFYVAAYLRAGPPTDIFDQGGRVCMPQFTDTLSVGASAETACSATIPQISGTYTLYGQVDVAPNSQTPAVGFVVELDEDNNLVTGSQVSITIPPEEGAKIYLPLIMRQ
jgi:hypothetical protein